jgi:hypothetical protein
MSYIGVQPVPRATRVRTFGALASATTTIAIPGGFSPSNIEVFIDGLYVQPTDYDDSDGFNLVFITTLALGTEYVVMEARNFEVANHYTKQEIQNAAFDFNTMPTVGGDPIVESGSNVDGEYTKFANGTMVCWKINTGSLSTTVLQGSVWRSIITLTWTFPIAFIGQASCSAGIDDATFAWVNATSGVTDSSIRGYGTDSIATSFEVNASAIGRWK